MAANPEWVRGFDDFYRPRSEHTSDLTPSTGDPYPYAVEWLSRFATRINAFERHFADPVRRASLAGGKFACSKAARQALDDVRWALRETRKHFASGILNEAGWEGKRLGALQAWARGLVMLYESRKLDEHTWSGDIQAHWTLLAVTGRMGAVL